MNNKKLYLIVFFVFGILLFSSLISGYLQTSYSPAYYNAMGVGMFSNARSLQATEEMCQQGTDFLIQLNPAGCSPSPVRSDLLEEENVNVFCQMTAIQINPFIDIQRINSIGFDKQYPREVLNIGYQPAQAALGYYQSSAFALGSNQNTNLEGFLTLQNLGYVVVTLRRQPNESALTNCEKGALGTEICWVEGNLTVTLNYNIQNIFGVGQAEFYLPSMDNTDWKDNYIQYGFWDGRGYIRADSVGTDSAVLSIYSDNSVASSLLAGKRTYNLAEYRSNIGLNVGETSDKIFLPGLSPCLASLQLRLDGIENPDTRATLKINEEYAEVALHETFLDGKCMVSDMQKKGVTSDVEITCSGADNSADRKPFHLKISPRIILNVDGIEKTYGTGDFLYEFDDNSFSAGRNNQHKYVYLGYVGSTVDSVEDENLYVTLVSIPANTKEGDINKLSESELSSVLAYSQSSTSSYDKSGKITNALVNAWNSYKGVSMNIGSSVLKGEDFQNVLYGIPVVSFNGKTVSIVGLSGAKEDSDFTSFNYTNAVSDFNAVIDNYPNEVEKQNSVQTLGEEALHDQILLADKVGKKKTLVSLCKEFAQNYPNSQLPLDICTNSLSLSNQDISVHEITVNGITKRISLAFDGIKEPSIDDYSAQLTVRGPNGQIMTYFLEKNKIALLEPSKFRSDAEKLTTTEYIRLDNLDTDSASIKINVQDTSAERGSGITSEEVVLRRGTPGVYGGYTFTLTKVNLKKVAKVSIIANREFAKSNSSFTFKIGIEKRNSLLKLSPEKAQEKIINTNKSIENWQKINNYLDGLVTAMRGACLGTHFVLAVKNAVASKDGKAIARQTVMTMTDGWNQKCQDEMKTNKNLKSLNACLLSHSDEIEKDVNSMASVIVSQNNFIGSKDINDLDFLKSFSNTVRNNLNSLPSGTLSQDELTKIQNILDPKNSELYIKNNAYNADSLKDIQLYTNYLQSSRSGSLDSAVINKLKSAISDVTTTAEKYTMQISFEQKTGMTGNSMIKSLSGIKTDIINIYNKILFKNTQYAGSDWNIDDTGHTNQIATSDKDYAYSIQDPISQLEYIIRYSIDGTVIQTYQIDSANKKLVIYREPDKTDTAKMVNVPNPFKLQFNLVDKDSYKNTYKASYGDSEPLVMYYENAMYKGRPAVVPFDKRGFYAGILSPATTSYDASGRVEELYICNVGPDGIESFQITNPVFGGDDCQLILMKDSSTFSTLFGMQGSDARNLVTKAKDAIYAAQKNYREGRTYVAINGDFPKVKVGKPADEINSEQCTDRWPVKDCTLLFNVCDPVVCPASRCDLGGAYPVKDVIQSGVIGSVVLCFPNWKPLGGDVYIPICVSGVKAGLEDWISVKKAYVDCLQRSIDTGETVGICDEMQSIYMCEFFWKQIIPIVKLEVPKLIDRIIGNGAKGGGEYNSFSSALKNFQESYDYFTQYYAANSYKIFKTRSTEQIGTEACGTFISAVVPGGNIMDFFGNLLSPDSPFQFVGKFEETQLTTATNPPTSQYSVWFHIYAGTDSGAYYTVYLRGSGSSYYQDTAQRRIVKSGYIERGGYADEKVDLQAPSGYRELCINVNGQEECGFKEVSTSFAVNYLSDLYVKDQVDNSDITTKKQCVSGTLSWYSLLDLNAQSAAENLLSPELSTQGITRTCATQNPGIWVDPLADKDGSRWVKVGYCDDKGIGCWIDTQSVKDAIKNANLEDQALDSIGYVDGNYLTVAEFNAKIDEINSLGVSIADSVAANLKKIQLINEVFAGDQVFYNNQKAKLVLLRGEAYAALASVDYEAYIEEYIRTHPCMDVCGDDGNVHSAFRTPSLDCEMTGLIKKECKQGCRNGICVEDLSLASIPGLPGLPELSEFDKTYTSPIFEFEDGTLDKNICYVFYDSTWHWMFASTGKGSFIIPSCNDPNFPTGRKWFPTDVFVDENGQVPNQKSLDFIKSLQDKTYYEGLILLIERTSAGKQVEGGISNPSLVEANLGGNKGISSMKSAGTFKTNMGNLPILQLSYQYTSTGWQRSPAGSSVWMDTKTFVVTSGGSKGEQLNQQQIDLLTLLDGKNLYQGAEILLDPTSSAVQNLFTSSSGGTCVNSQLGSKIVSIAVGMEGQDTTRTKSNNIVYDHVCATFVSNVLIEAGALPQFSSCALEWTPYRDAIVELIALFKEDGYTEISKSTSSGWQSNLKPGDLVIWGGTGSYDPEYQHITIFSGYDGNGGINVIHDPGVNGKITQKTYTDGPTWYITHVWRAVCPVSSS